MALEINKTFQLSLLLVNQIKNIPPIRNQQTDKYKNVPKEYMQVAEGMESQFTNHLLNEMRKSVN